MNAASRLSHDLESTIALASPRRLERTLRRLTDLFLVQVDDLSEAEIEVFDQVITRLTLAIEGRARAELAERLADVARAPHGVIRALAHDAIAIARPVLVRSERLTDEDLVAVAIARGREHMLAIAARSSLTEPVTDILVSRGDRGVVHAVTRNAGAQLSPDGIAILVNRSLADDDLRDLLGNRCDLPKPAVFRLIEIAKRKARQHLNASLPADLQPAVAGAVERSAIEVRAVVAASLDYREALDTVGTIALGRPVDEADVAGFAVQGRLEETICAIASVAGLSVRSAERLFTAAEADLLLVVGRAQEWSWRTMETLLNLRDPALLRPHMRKRLKASYEDLTAKTAQQVLNLLRRPDVGHTSSRLNVR